MSNSDIKEIILVVDDTPTITEFVQYVLEEKGYKTIACNNGTQALVMAQEYRPDLILLDIMMPDVDGYIICSQLKADRKTRDIPVIFLSALNSQFDKIKAFKCGAVDFVTKPVQPEELTARVKSHLTISSLNRALQMSKRDLESLVSERTKELEDSNRKLAELNSRLEKTINDYREAKRKADSSNDYKSTFLSKLSHEVFNNTNIIVGFAELINATSDAAKHTEYVNCIKSSASTLVDIMTNIVEYNNVISDKYEASIQRVNVGATIQNVYLNYIDKAKEAGLDIVVNNDNGESFEIFTDENMLATILGKLVSNSLKFSKKGNIEIGASNSDGTAVFYVKDSGMGISPDLIDHVFEPFARGNMVYSKSGRGLGLGLSIVKEYVQKLGGEIWFDSSPGVGTIFYLSLPINTGLSTVTVDSQSLMLKGVNVLVGEDEDVSFVMLDDILKAHGINVYRAKSGKELFELFRQTRDVQMIISNLKLPMMNGAEAMKLIRNVQPSIITVAQVSYFSAEDKRAFAESGCNCYIDKPVNAMQVRDLLAKYLVRK